MKKEIRSLGIELGSTRIKAVLVDADGKVLYQGNHEWENQLENGYWTYSLDAVWTGVQDAYRKLAQEYEKSLGEPLKKIHYMGFSAMMHGYLPFDAEGQLLTPFRTWRNVNTEQASRALSDLLQFNIPHRWSIAHLYQAMLDGEEHVKRIDFLTTLAGYVHWQLTGERVLGIGDAAGMFPIDSVRLDYDQTRMDQFEQVDLVQENGISLEKILPKVLAAGQSAGRLTEEGAKLLDPSGLLEAGSLVCPPEGDAGTGMVATNSVLKRTGNISAGTSIFAMVVLEEGLKNYYPEVDMVTTPDGLPVAMVHCNNGTPELDAWVNMFVDFAAKANLALDRNRVYEILYKSALEGQENAGEIISVNFLAGEPIAKVQAGRPMYMRSPDSKLNLSNFFLSQLYSIVASLRLGVDILIEKEDVSIDSFVGHGGVFKTAGVMQKVMAAALKVPVAVYESAGEGGAWGIALLALYLESKDKQSLVRFLGDIFGASNPKTFSEVDSTLASGFDRYLADYQEVLHLERSAENMFTKA